MGKNWREIPDTGHVVKNDQTVTLRVHHAKKRVRGKMRTACPAGCGAYLTDEEKFDHQCAPAISAHPSPPKSNWRNKAIRKALAEIALRKTMTQIDRPTSPHAQHKPKAKPFKKQFQPDPKRTERPRELAKKVSPTEAQLATENLRRLFGG